MSTTDHYTLHIGFVFDTTKHDQFKCVDMYRQLYSLKSLSRSTTKLLP